MDRERRGKKKGCNELSGRGEEFRNGDSEMDRKEGERKEATGDVADRAE